MGNRIRTAITGIVMLALLAGCSISTRVKPVPDEKISQLCIKKNPDVLMDGFLPELEAQIASYGITPRIYEQTLPKDCEFHMNYTANWLWDLAMYLAYAELKVYNGNDLIGEAVYDARSGSGRMDKFGTTAEKLKTLTGPLFNHRGVNVQ